MRLVILVLRHEYAFNISFSVADSSLFFSAPVNACVSISQVTGLELDVGQMQSAKGKAVDALTGGIEYLFKKYGVDYLKGKGSLGGPNTVR